MNSALCKLACCLAMLVAGVASPAFAQNSLTRGDVTVHYNAVATTSLDAEVARRYAIARSPARALLNLVVLRTGDDELPAPIRARIVATMRNAAGDSEALALREVVDGASISYLAEPRLAPSDTLAFDLLVTPEGAEAPIEVRFEQAFFPEPRGR